jgi:hypothetical protein
MRYFLEIKETGLTKTHLSGRQAVDVIDGIDLLPSG